jgi:hypothetical protein
MREQRNPLVCEWRIRGLRKTGKPLLVPGIEPMLGIVRSEEDVKVGVVGSIQGQLHDQQRSVNRQRQKYDRRQGDRPSEIAGLYGNRSPPQLCEQLFDST